MRHFFDFLRLQSAPVFTRVSLLSEAPKLVWSREFSKASKKTMRSKNNFIGEQASSLESYGAFSFKIFLQFFQMIPHRLCLFLELMLGFDKCSRKDHSFAIILTLLWKLKPQKDEFFCLLLHDDLARLSSCQLLLITMTFATKVLYSLQFGFFRSCCCFSWKIKIWRCLFHISRHQGYFCCGFLFK